MSAELKQTLEEVFRCWMQSKCSVTVIWMSSESDPNCVLIQINDEFPQKVIWKQLAVNNQATEMFQ